MVGWSEQKKLTDEKVFDNLLGIMYHGYTIQPLLSDMAHTLLFLWHCRCHYEFNMVCLKSCIVFCAKPKEVILIKINFSMTNKCFDSTQMYN